MAIPDGQMYGTGELGAGEVTSIEPAITNTEQAGAAIGFGQGVQLKNGQVVPATSGNIYGVAIRRTHINSDHLYPQDVQNDKWQKGEYLGVLRDGVIAVPVSADVNAKENAAVDANGNFKPAGASDTVVGVFLSAGDAGHTANMQTRIQLSNTSVTGNGVTDANAPTAPATPDTSLTDSHNGSAGSNNNGGSSSNKSKN